MSWPWRDSRTRPRSVGTSGAESAGNNCPSTASVPASHHEGETGFSTGPSGVSSIVNWTETLPAGQQRGSPGA